MAVHKLKVVKPVPDQPEEPIDEYLNAVQSGTAATLPYDRLMIYYRKEKNYQEELNIIRKGIDTLKKFYANLQKETLGRKINPKIKALSKQISKTTGLHDKKGNEVFLPDPLPRWMKRESVVLEKLKKQKSKGKKKK
jgi:hypothetical protein